MCRHAISPVPFIIKKKRARKCQGRKLENSFTLSIILAFARIRSEYFGALDRGTYCKSTVCVVYDSSSTMISVNSDVSKISR